MCFLLLTDGSAEQKTNSGQSALDIAKTANHLGSHDQVIALLQGPAISKEVLLEQLVVESDDEED